MNYTRSDVVKFARSYVGTRWAHCGRSRSGLDCVGLLVCVGRDLGLEIEDLTGYKRTPDSKVFLEHIRKQSVPGNRERIRPGSIILLKQVFYPCHCGIATFIDARPYIVHAALKQRRVVEEPLTPMWKDIIDVREFRGIR